MRPEPIHILILLGLLLLAAIVVAAIVFVVVLIRRSGRAKTPAAGTVASAGIADELSKLTDLRDRGALSAAEYEAQKRRLLGGSS